MKQTLLPLLLLAAPCLAQAGEGNEPWDIGLAVTAAQSPFIDGDTAIGAKPVLLDKSGFGIAGPAWSFSKTEQREFYIGAGLDDWDHKRGDSPQLDGMDELDRAINLRAGAAWKLPHGVVSADLAQDVAAHKGSQAKLRYTYNPAPYQAALKPYAEAQWLSADTVDYYVGVDADEARAGRAAYKADGTMAVKVGLSLQQPLGESFTLVGGVDATHYGKEVGDSPLVDRSTVWGGYAGVAYRW